MTEPTLPKDGAVAELAADAASRKRFLKMAGAGAAGSLALLISACGGEGRGSGVTERTYGAVASQTQEA